MVAAMAKKPWRALQCCFGPSPAKDVEGAQDVGTQTGSDAKIFLQALRADTYPAFTAEGPCGPLIATYMDHAASGRPLKSFESLLQEHVVPYYANTHTETSARKLNLGAITINKLYADFGMRTNAMMEQARLDIASAVNAPRDEYAVIFAGSGATNALHLLAYTLLHHHQGRQNEAVSALQPLVFLSPYEHHSNELLWREQKCDIVVIGHDIEGRISLTQLEATLQQQRMLAPDRLLIGCFSAGSNVTGITSPVDEISVLMHQYGGLACFDYAAAGSYVLPVMTAREGACPLAYKDAVALSLHKLPGGPGASGVLVSRRELFRVSAPPRIPGGGTVVWTSQYGHAFTDDIEAREEGGTPNILANIRTGMAMRLCATVSEHPYIHAHEQALTRLLVEGLMAIPGVMVLGADQPGTLDWSTRLGIVSILIAAPAMNPQGTDNPSGSKQHGTAMGPLPMSSAQSSSSSTYHIPAAGFNAQLQLSEDCTKQSDGQAYIHSSNSGSQDNSSLVGQQDNQKLLHHHYVCKLLSDVYGIQARSGCNCAGPYGLSLLISMFRNFLAARISAPDFKPLARCQPCCTRHASYHGDEPPCKLCPDEANILQAMSEMGAPKLGWTRLSIKYLNTHDDIMYALEAVKQIARDGWRLLPQYQIELGTGTWKWLGEQSSEGYKPSCPPLCSLDVIPHLSRTKPTLTKSPKAMFTTQPQQQKPVTYSDTQLTAMRQQYLVDAQKAYMNAASWVIDHCKVNHEPWSHPLPADMEIWRWWVSPKEAAEVMLQGATKGSGHTIPIHH